MKTSCFKLLPSPVGTLKAVASDEGLVAILWETERLGRVRIGAPSARDDHPVIVLLEQQLKEYFAGERETFDVPLAPEGTPFQREVWEALRAIPFGETRSYADIARQIGRPKAVRAVGAANGRNPICIVTPCHRVIGANGALTGFAGGLKAKAFLLELERRSVAPAASFVSRKRRGRRFYLDRSSGILPLIS